MLFFMVGLLHADLFVKHRQPSSTGLMHGGLGVAACLRLCLSASAGVCAHACAHFSPLFLPLLFLPFRTLFFALSVLMESSRCVCLFVCVCVCVCLCLCVCAVRWVDLGVGEQRIQRPTAEWTMAALARLMQVEGVGLGLTCFDYVKVQ